MRNVSENAYQAMRTLDYKIVTNDNGTVYTTADIISMDIQRKLTDKGVSIGNAISDRLSVTLRKSENDIPKKTRFTVYVKFGDDADWTMIGKFYVTKCTKSKHGYLNVTCMDFLNLLDKECKWKAGGGASALTFPATHQQMLDYIIARYSLTCNFVCQDWTQETKPEGYTYRQILGFIAASHAANVQIDEDGVVTFVQFHKDDVVSYPLSASNVVSQTIDETAGYTVNGIYFEVDDNTDIYIDDVEGSEYDEDAVGIVKVKNPFASVAIANYCWEHLGGLSYISTTIAKRATTALQCGDVITVYDYAGEPAELKAAVTSIHYTVSASGGFQEQITSYADTGENQKTTSNKKAEKANSIPKDFFSAADPALTASNKVKKDDEWYVRNNDTDKYLVEIKRRVLVSEASAENEAVYEWEIVAVIPTGGSGVGEWLDDDHTAEIFNAYDSSSQWCPRNITTRKYDHIEGYGNISTGSEDPFWYSAANHIEGCYNSAYNSMYSYVGGSGNKCGTQEDGRDVYGNLMHGSGNKILGCNNSAVLGSGSELSSSYSALLIGNGTKARNMRNCVLFGSGGDYDINGDYRFIVAQGSNYFFTVDTSGYVSVFGNVTAAGYNTRGADYAEYFEWLDGNPENEDRRGMLVIQDGNKIIPALGDKFLGAISVRPSVTGNAYESYWHGKYQTDVFGCPILDKEGMPRITPEYDDTREYIPRSKRPEWAVVGLLGCVIIIDDGSCKPGGYVSARNGIGTSCYAPTRAQVLRRIDENHIEVLIR